MKTKILFLLIIFGLSMPAIAKGGKDKTKYQPWLEIKEAVEKIEEIQTWIEEEKKADNWLAEVEPHVKQLLTATESVLRPQNTLTTVIENYEKRAVVKMGRRVADENTVEYYLAKADLSLLPQRFDEIDCSIYFYLAEVTAKEINSENALEKIKETKKRLTQRRIVVKLAEALSFAKRGKTVPVYSAVARSFLEIMNNKIKAIQPKDKKTSPFPEIQETEQTIRKITYWYDLSAHLQKAEEHLRAGYILEAKISLVLAEISAKNLKSEIAKQITEIRTRIK